MINWWLDWSLLAHERSIHTDISLGLLKKILKKRDDLKVIVSSATMDAEALRDFFEMGTPDNPSATILSVEGRTFPVETFYLREPVANYLHATVDTVLKIHRTQPLGDVLAFLTGQEEVDHVCQLLGEHSDALERETGNRLNAVPLYGSLPPGDQLKAFELPAPKTRKIVVATNIAETSVTINGIVYVSVSTNKVFEDDSRLTDHGKTITHRQKSWTKNYRRPLDLHTQPCSKMKKIARGPF